MRERNDSTLPGGGTPVMSGAWVSIFVGDDHPLLQLKQALDWDAIQAVMVTHWRAAGKNVDGGYVRTQTGFGRDAGGTDDAFRRARRKVHVLSRRHLEQSRSSRAHRDRPADVAVEPSEPGRQRRLPGILHEARQLRALPEHRI